MDTFELIKGAIDIHIHIGPDPNRRRRVRVERTIITHPLSVSFGCRASVEEQKEMIGQGVFIEHCIMSTDFGQIYNPPPVEGMRMYIETMLRCGIEEDEIVAMVRKNPAHALGLPVL